LLLDTPIKAMNTSIKLPYSLLLTLFVVLTSCVQDDITESCLDVDQITEIDWYQGVKIHTSKIIQYRISNKCNSIITVLNTEVKGINKNDFQIQGISNNSEITTKGVIFSIKFSPRIIGDKKATISINTDSTDILIHLNNKGIY